LLLASALFPLVLPAHLEAADSSQLLLDRDATEVRQDFKGIVEVVVKPPFDNARVSIAVDGQPVTEGLRTPYHLRVDLGPVAVEHRLTITAFTPDWKKVQWHQTINQGLRALTVRLKLIDPGQQLYEAIVTAPQGDPVQVVEFWSENALIGRVKEAPYRMNVPESVARALIHVTARARSGEEADDFISDGAEVHIESFEVRTVPIFVSVVDRNGTTLDNLERSSFKVLDNGAEAKILEFSRAFNQPISLALLIDTSSSMNAALASAARSALTFAERTLRDGDRCAVFSIRSVPRREQELTSDRTAIEKVLHGLRAGGDTALYDSLSSAIRELSDEKNRKAIVVLTDGADTSSVAAYGDVERQARIAGIPIYVIAYGDSPDLKSDMDKLRYIAAETGGFVTSASEESLGQRYASIEKDLRAQYAIRYQISGLARPNEWRQIKVILNSPKLTARTIKGYFAR
jgi:Ca-activated chloride channel homolog